MSDFFSLMEFFKNNEMFTSEDEIPEPVATKFMEDLIKDLTIKDTHGDDNEDC